MAPGERRLEEGGVDEGAAAGAAGFPRDWARGLSANGNGGVVHSDLLDSTYVCDHRPPLTDLLIRSFRVADFVLGRPQF